MTVLEQWSKIKGRLSDSSNFDGSNQCIHEYSENSCASTFRNELLPIEKAFYLRVSFTRGGGRRMHFSHSFDLSTNSQN